MKHVKKECVAMLLAGGQGSRLYALTKDMAKPAVPHGGPHRPQAHGNYADARQIR